jgi:hypothetical protein
MQPRRRGRRPKTVRSTGPRPIPTRPTMAVILALVLAVCAAACAAPAPSTERPRPTTPDATIAPASGGPAGSTGLPSVDSVTTDRADDGEFDVSISVDKGSYAPDEPITAAARLVYLGPGATVTAFGSGSGLVTFDLQQLDGPLDPGGGATSDCRPYQLARNEPLDIPYAKSGGWSEEDPNAAWYAVFFNEPELRLPAGVWRLTARLEAATGTSCGDPWHRVEASVTFLVDG